MLRQSELTQSAFFQTNRVPAQVQQGEEQNQFLRLPSLPVDIRLKENRERRMMLEYERLIQKEKIMKKRKEKEENVQRVLRERSQAKQNAKLMFDPCMKTCGNRFGIDLDWKKAEDIQKKIDESRNRAELYRTLYQKKIHKENQEKEKNAKKRINEKQNKSIQKSLNYHLAEWNNYQMKIAQKYSGQKINEKRLYETYFKKESEIKNMLKDHQKQSIKQKLNTEEIESEEPKRLLVKKKKDKAQNQKIQIQTNPINQHGELSTFGLQKSIKNPQKILQQFLTFIEDSTGLKSPSQDEQLLQKFEKLLEKDIDI